MRRATFPPCPKLKDCQDAQFEIHDFSLLVQVKSLALLEQTNCVIYDDLAAQDGLARCKPGTEVVYVGKRGGTPSPKQSDICKLLVSKCQQHDHVCPSTQG
jgi:siroheme synthase